MLSGAVLSYQRLELPFWARVGAPHLRRAFSKSTGAFAEEAVQYEANGGRKFMMNSATKGWVPREHKRSPRLRGLLS
jgi:hypothetical protein